MSRNLLFICSHNRRSSPTAERVFADYQSIETASAGLNNDAESPITPEIIEWADIIFVMERAHRNKFSSKFKKHLSNKPVICLDIPDEYEYMDPVLIGRLKVNVIRHLPSCSQGQ